VFATDLPAVQDEPSTVKVDSVPAWQRLPIAIRWVAGAVAVLALGEALFIGRLFYLRARTGATPAAVSLESTRAVAAAAGGGQAAAVAQLQSQVAVPPRSVPIAPVAAASQSARGGPANQTSSPLKPPAPKSAETAPVPAGSTRSGGFRLSSAIEVHVLEGDRLLGSSGDGAIVAAAGQHEFEFVNSSIGYRERKSVSIKPGQITSISVAVPNGTLNINAVPWAAVWIDSTPFGETPLGNLSIAPGEHEIVFRHPQLGERREKTLVRAGSTTRVSVNLTGR
jgi:hypothetical protein